MLTINVPDKSENDPLRSGRVISNYWRFIDSISSSWVPQCASAFRGSEMDCEYSCKSDCLSEGFILGRDKGALDLVSKGQSCMCEFALHATQISEMAVSLAFRVSWRWPALTSH